MLPLTPAAPSFFRTASASNFFGRESTAVTPGARSAQLDVRSALRRRRVGCYGSLVARVADEAAAAVIRDLGGGEHRLDELWAERPAVLVFLRHFG